MVVKDNLDGDLGKFVEVGTDDLELCGNSGEKSKRLNDNGLLFSRSANNASNNGDPKVDEFKNVVFVKEECFRVVGQNSVLLRAGAEILEVVVTPAHHVCVA